MSYKLLITPFAELDLIEIKSWYTSHEYTIYQKFISELDKVINLLIVNPEEFPLVYRKYRKAVLKRFPYKIIYTSDKGYVKILAVIHHKRNPKIWKSRIH